MQKRRNFSAISAVFVLSVFLLHTGTIRKQEDPIRDTQTNPILHKQKMEEIKDGEKGPPTPSFRYYLKRLFLLDLPFFGSDKKDPSEEAVPERGAVSGVNPAAMSERGAVSGVKETAGNVEAPI